MPLYCPVSILSFLGSDLVAPVLFLVLSVLPFLLLYRKIRAFSTEKKLPPITPSLSLYSSELLILRCLFSPLSLLSAHLYLLLSFLHTFLPSVRLLNTHPLLSPLLSPLLTLHIPLSLFSFSLHGFRLFTTFADNKTALA